MMEILIKASLAIAIALLFYKFLLQQESFFAANRVFLLGSILLAFTLPFITLPEFTSQQGYLSAVLEKQLSMKEKNENNPLRETSIEQFPPSEVLKLNSIPAAHLEESEQILTQNSNGQIYQGSGEKDGYSFLFWVAILYFFGIAVFVISLLFQLGYLFYKVKTSKDKIRDGNFVIVNIKERSAPCSFLKYIFINPQDYNYETYEQIIAHEKTHLRFGHSLDLFIAELAVILLWFNPLIWLFKKEIEKNIEYQTDSFLVDKEVVQKDLYQLNLLHIVVPNKPLNLTTNYNQSLIGKRILMMNSKKSLPHAYWKYVFLAPVIFTMLTLFNEPAVSQEQNFDHPISDYNTFPSNNPEEKFSEIKEEDKSTPQQESNIGQSENINYSEAEVKKNIPIAEKRIIQKIQKDRSFGLWTSSRTGEKICMEFKEKENGNTWSWSMKRCFQEEAFKDEINNRFSINRESGSLQLHGNLKSDLGEGKYNFKENDLFRKYLSSLGISADQDNLLLYLFFGDVEKNYVDFLKEQYPDLNAQQLSRIAIKEIPEEEFRKYLGFFEKNLGMSLSIDELIQGKQHDIDEEFLVEINKMNIRDLRMKDLVTIKLLEVSAPYVESLRKAGMNNLTLSEILQVKKLNINASYIEQFKKHGLDKLNMEEIVNAKLNGLDEEQISVLNSQEYKSFQKLGFEKIPIYKMIELQKLKIDDNYIIELQNLMFTGITIDQVIMIKRHGLDISSIKELQALGVKKFGLREAMSANQHNVDADFVKELNSAGFSNLGMPQIVNAKIRGVDKNFIEDSRKKGYNLENLDEYIALKSYGSAMDKLRNN